MIDVFTPKRISTNCPFKRNQRQVKILTCSVLFVSAVSCTPLRSSPRCAAHHRDCLHSGLHTQEIFSTFGALDSEVCCTPRRWSPGCAKFCRDRPCGVLHTVEIISVVCTEIFSAVCCTPWRSHRGDFFEFWALTLRCATHRGDCLWCVESISTVCNMPPRCAAHRGDNFVIEYLVTHSL